MNSGSTKDTSRASRVSFFRVSLVCEAAPNVGCGTIARPVLAEIDREHGVREAWLNRSGTVLGTVWEDAANPARVLRVLTNHGVSAVELTGNELRVASEEFASGHDWYQAAQLQELSAEEARVIAERLVLRLDRKLSVPTKAATLLVLEVERACAQVLRIASATSASTRREQIAAALIDAGRVVLEPAPFADWREVVALGHRPLPGED